MDVIKVADHIIDIGPEGGEKGGTVICEGTPEEIIQNEKSHTAKYLRKEIITTSDTSILLKEKMSHTQSSPLRGDKRGAE